MDLKWTSSALNDLTEAGVFVAAENPEAAEAMADRVREAVLYLADYPSLGRSGRIQGTRELVVSGTPFIVLYRVREDRIEFLRVLHHARKWPA